MSSHKKTSSSRGSSSSSKPKTTLTRVDTPPSLKEARSRVQAQNASLGLGNLSLDDKDRDLTGSPNSLTGCGESTTAFPNSLIRYIETKMSDDGSKPAQKSAIRYYNSGIRVADLKDYANHRPQYTQSTQSAFRKKVKSDPLGKKAEVDGKEVAIFKFKGEIYAIKNQCCHQGASLWEGDIEEVASRFLARSNEPGSHRPCVTCPRHSWSFDLETGKCLVAEDLYQPVYSCLVEKGTVWVGFDPFVPDAFDSKIDF